MSTLKLTNSNRKIFSDYVICMKHAYRRVHCGDDESVSLKLKTMKALVYQ